MLKHLKAFWKEEEGLGTVEIVLILVVLIALALVFKDTITSFFNTLISDIKGKENEFNIDDISNEANK